MKYFIVDVFAKAPFLGNPAGVVICDNFPKEEIMIHTAQKLNCANTAFVKRIKQNHFQIKWYTVTSEAPLCGHATLGSTHILKQLNMIDHKSVVKFESMSGDLFATAKENLYELNFPAFVLTDTKLPELFNEIIDVEYVYSGFGRNCYFIELKSFGDLKKVTVDLDILKNHIDARALILTAQHPEYDFASRYFAPRVGIMEDPVCVSSHCLLIPYWASKLNKTTMIAITASERGGYLHCKLDLNNRVLISGEAVTIKEDYLEISNNLRNYAV
jgi:PhzF family phenazine biosynthesis protein